MKRVIVLGTAATLFLSLPQARAAKSISALSALPGSITANTASTVKISAVVSPDPNLITSSITLVRVSPLGATLATLGVLTDDGTGTNNYTGQFTFNEAPGNVNLMVTAGYKGTLLRTKSPVFSLVIKPSYVFPLKSSGNHRYFVDQNGVPFLMVGDAPMSLVSMTSPAQQDFYFANRRARGFNAVWINVLCTSYTGCPANGQTAGGVAPFTVGSSPSDYDLSTPNLPYFALYDSAISVAASYGLVVFLDPIETGGWLTTLRNNGPTQAFNYGVFIGNLFKNHSNLVWLHGNDFAAYTNPSDNNLVQQVILGISSVDSAHFHSIELGTSAYLANSDVFSTQDALLAPLLGANLAYSWAPTYNVMLDAYNSTPTMPVFLGEGNYEFENVVGLLAQPTGQFLLRETSYWVFTSGGAGYIYGSNTTWTSSWVWNPSSLLDTPGALQITYINSLFNGLPWWNLVPDQTHSVVTAGYGVYTFGNSDPTTNTYCSTSWSPGTVSVTYCPAATTLTVDMSRFSAPVTAWWFDPSVGTFTSVSGSPFSNSGTRNIATPGTNSAGNSDWALVLRTQ